MKTRTTYYCEYCKRSFSSRITCEKHEPKCLEKQIETEKILGMLLSLVRHFEKKGYTITIRYDSKDSEDVIVYLR